MSIRKKKIVRAISSMLLAVILCVGAFPVTAGAKVSKIGADAKVAAGYYRLIPVCAPKTTITIQNASKKSGGNVYINAKNNSKPSKVFYIKPVGSSLYTIQNLNSGMYVEVKGGKTAVHTNIQQGSYKNKAYQKWYITKAKGAYVFQSAVGNRVMTVKNSKSANRTNVWTQKFLGTKGQRYKLEKVSASAAKALVKKTASKTASAAKTTTLAVNTKTAKTAAKTAVKTVKTAAKTAVKTAKTATKTTAKTVKTATKTTAKTVKTKVNLKTMTKQQFIDTVAKYVKKYASKYGIKISSPIIAQAILESNWGKSRLSWQYYNLFGMKCGSKWKGRSVNMRTLEEYTIGKHTAIRANFRVYSSIEEGVKGYFEFIQLARYRNLRGIKNPQTYLKKIRADGYCNSSTYVRDCMNLIKKYNLTKYDK